LRILHVLARSGGTLVGRCLASMSEAMLLSEIHPRGLASPVRQAARWFGLVTTEEAARLDGPAQFPAAIALLRQRAEAQGKKLILREWSHLDFYGWPYVEDSLWRSSLADLFAGDFTLRRAALVRHPVEQLFSMSQLVVMQGRRDLGRFLMGYRRFAEMAAETGFVRYEDFTREPDAALRRLCGLLDLDFDPAYALRWAGWNRITGDGADSRGGGEPRIRPLPPWPTSPAMLARLAEQPDYRKALALLGYAHPGEEAPAAPG
jgi:hypothetical protein